MTYKIVRFYRDTKNKRTRAIKTGLTLKEAQDHCQRPETQGNGWFDGYEEETGRAPRKRSFKRQEDSRIANHIERRPSIHLNGSGAQSLFDDYYNALQAVQTAQAKLLTCSSFLGLVPAAGKGPACANPKREGSPVSSLGSRQGHRDHSHRFSRSRSMFCNHCKR